MAGRRYIRLCPQHDHPIAPFMGRPEYLHRNCPSCMGWLSQHPEDAHLARQHVQQGPGGGHRWLPQLQRANERKRKEARETAR